MNRHEKRLQFLLLKQHEDWHNDAAWIKDYADTVDAWFLEVAQKDVDMLEDFKLAILPYLLEPWRRELDARIRYSDSLCPQGIRQYLAIYFVSL